MFEHFQDVLQCHDLPQVTQIALLMQELMEVSKHWLSHIPGGGSQPQNTYPDFCRVLCFWMNTAVESQPFPGTFYPIMMNAGLQIIHTDPGS